MLKQYLIERKVPGIGEKTAEEFQRMARMSNEVLWDMGGQDIQWQESFVTKDYLFCVYSAKDETTVRAHTQRIGLPADRITEIRKVLGPASGHEVSASEQQAQVRNIAHG